MGKLFSRHRDYDLGPIKMTKEDQLTESALPTPSNVAAIDFGTTYISAAFKTYGDEEGTILALDGTNRRVPNVVMLEKTDSLDEDSFELCSVKEIGFEAQSSYTKIKKQDYPNRLYFQQVKLTLKDDVHREVKVKAIDRQREYYAVEVIALTFKHIRDMLLETVKQQGHNMKPSDFLWVITVPAIWGPKGKQLMREASYMAGLCSTKCSGIKGLTDTSSSLKPRIEDHPEKIILALEPEAAALACLELTADKIAQYCRESPGLTIPPRYMVLDIGGGTVDIAAYETKQSHRTTLDAISPPFGNAFGGTTVNRAFEEFFTILVGGKEHLMSKMNASKVKAKEWANFNSFVYVEFEKEKLGFANSESSYEDMRLSVPSSLVTAFEDRLRQVKLPLQFSPDDEVLYIPYSMAEEFFQLAVEGIQKYTITALEQAEGNMDVIYLVGGFGGCKYIYEKVKQAVDEKYAQRKMKIIVPCDQNLMVVRGALRYGSDPKVFTGRKADATYGVATTLPYQKGDEVAFKYKKDGRDWTDNIFNVCVEKDDFIPSNCVFTTTMTPRRKDQKTMDLEIFKTDRCGVRYIMDTEERLIVDQIGCLRVRLPDCRTKKDQRVIKLTINFSDTEIKAKAYCEGSDEVNHLIIDCL